MATAADPLEKLLELTRLLSAERSLEEALQATTDAALALLPGDHASLRLFDDERNELLSSARSGEGTEHAPAQFRSGEGILGIVADTGKPAMIADAAEAPGFQRRRDVGFPIRSLIAVPLFAGGQVIGVLSCSHREPGVFERRHLELEQLLANCTVPAIETARLARLAVTDDLTRAYNYRYHATRLGEEVARVKRYGGAFTLLLLDLDLFKNVNDRWGHQVGDEVLRGFADRVRAEVRDTDVLIRRGGEEFVLLMPSTSTEEAYVVAERIRSRVGGAPIETSAGEVPLTVSVGLATWREGESATEVEARADQALYAAKRGGRDRTEISEGG